jgi:osmoprotectant transport system permease protein
MPGLIQNLLDAWTTAEFWEETSTFLSLVLGSLGIALLVGIPIGILLTRVPRIAAPVIAVLGVLQTFPSLALLGILIPVLGIGEPAAIFLAVVYSLFPVVMNTYVGITQVPAAIRDAARGMGMTGRQILTRVDLPLSLPVVLAGVRTGAVYAIGIITVCAVAGIRGLGSYIWRGMSRSDNFLIAVGVVPVLALTLLVFWGLGGIAWVARRRNHLGLALGGGLILLLSLHGVWVIGKQLAPREQVRVGGKNFVEGDILAQIVKQMLEAHTDLRVEIVPNLTPNVIYKGLESGQIDLYPEYTGTLLANKEAVGLPVPSDRSTITELVRKELRRRHDLILLDTFGLDNTYAICAPKALARKYHLEKISDLRRTPGLLMGVDVDFPDRDDGWRGLIKTYGLKLREPPRAMTPDFRYQALKNGTVDLVCGFATDWEIAFYDLVVLKDDRHYFPNYHGAPVVRGDVLRRHPEIARVLNRLHNQIDDDTMRRLNYQVARERRTEAAVAREFLLKKGLIR